MTTNISDTRSARSWISQFPTTRQREAITLLDSLKFVSSDDFRARIVSLLMDLKRNEIGAIALYTEREIRVLPSTGQPDRLFKERRGKVRRAYGPGPQPVRPRHTTSPQVGSEGVVANILTSMVRADGKRFVSHPGPDQIRDREVRHVVIATDIIGSGQRSYTYLQSMWRLYSVKSWYSRQHIRFHIVAYCATEQGIRRVTAHACRPTVHQVVPCPTIGNTMGPEDANRIRQLCIKFDPKRADPVESLGWRGAETLVVFAHGIPNTAPRILHRTRKNKWDPLFPRRTLVRLHDEGLVAESTQRLNRRSAPVAMVLRALRKGPRWESAVSLNTGLTIPEVRQVLQQLESWQWIDTGGRLTSDGRSQLRALDRDRERRTQTVLPHSPDFYYPNQLRSPVGV